MFEVIEIIQSILLVISAILMIISAIGVVSLREDLKNVVYARVHIFGVFDVACILALIGLNQFLLAIIYLIIAPFTAHAISNAYFKSEDTLNNPYITNNNVDNGENPFIYPKAKVQELEKKKLKINKKSNDKITISTLKISEDE